MGGLTAGERSRLIRVLGRAKYGRGQRDNASPVFDDDLLEAKRLLVLWGECLRAYVCRGGVRPVSVASFIHGDEIFVRDDQVGPGTMNEDAEWVEAELVRLKKVLPQVCQALVCDYYYENTITSGAEWCRCSPAEYKSRRKIGEAFMAGTVGKRRAKKKNT